MLRSGAAAEFLEMTRKRFRLRIIARDAIPCIRSGGGNRFYWERDLISFADGCASTPAELPRPQWPRKHPAEHSKAK
jgi:hypothetical protein